MSASLCFKDPTGKCLVLQIIISFPSALISTAVWFLLYKGGRLQRRNAESNTYIYIDSSWIHQFRKNLTKKKVDAWIMGKKTSVKLTHSTVYIPWVEKKGFFWNDFSFHFSVPPPKRIGMYMKVGPDSTRRTCKRSLHKLYSTENSVEVNMPACCCILTTVFSLIRFKFCTKFRVCKH